MKLAMLFMRISILHLIILKQIQLIELQNQKLSTEPDAIWQ
ncbi:hypothetical protein GLYMA_18G170250v4 [Glycine max]|nr:hypothetical protein GLYMA_18G170250v4 [Glycine max]KAH1154839.1 hypothetical protein GYH30_050225 [Glycine max]